MDSPIEPSKYYQISQEIDVKMTPQTQKNADLHQ